MEGGGGEEQGDTADAHRKGVWIMQSKQHPFSAALVPAGSQIPAATREFWERGDFLPVIILRLFTSAAGGSAPPLNQLDRPGISLLHQ